MAEVNKAIRTIEDLEITGKVLFLRLDLNVPLSQNSDGTWKVDNDKRIREALPTVRYAIEKGAKVVLASHLGRPKAKRNPDFSLEPVALHLADLLGQEVTLADDCVGEGIEMMVRGMKNGQVLLLENLRFHAGEEGNDPKFVAQLARLCEVYVTDAFGTAHRKHASTYGLPALVKDKGVGFLIQKELQYMDRLLEAPPKPFYLILGGAKVSDKIKTIESLMRNVNGVLVGGAMAYAFLAAKGDKVPENAKQPSPEDIEAARGILRRADRNDIPVVLPSDTVEAFDIGPRTVTEFNVFLNSARTVFWNGPLGWFEKPEYAKGTFEVAKHLAAVKAMKIVGGGDTVSAIEDSGLAEKFDHLSTGGGAVLEYLEGKGLPGIDILKSGRLAKSQTLDLDSER